ncbi:hypothetical protein ThvES_00020530, partial [Thiovulum sp. ES]
MEIQFDSEGIDLTDILGINDTDIIPRLRQSGNMKRLLEEEQDKEYQRERKEQDKRERREHLEELKREQESIESENAEIQFRIDTEFEEDEEAYHKVVQYEPDAYGMYDLNLLAEYIGLSKSGYKRYLETNVKPNVPREEYDDTDSNYILGSKKAVNLMISQLGNRKRDQDK